MTDWELWACAAKVRTDYGDQAEYWAMQRALTLGSEGDVAGHRTWIRIMKRIIEFDRAPTGEPLN